MASSHLHVHVAGLVAGTVRPDAGRVDRRAAPSAGPTGSAGSLRS